MHTPATAKPRQARTLLWAASACAACATSHALAATYSITPLTIPGAALVSLGGITDGGRVYGTYTDRRGNIHGFTIANGSMISYNLDRPKEAQLVANDGGELAGTETIGNLTYRFTISGGALKRSPPAQVTRVVGLDNRGDIAGSGAKGGQDQSFGIFQPAGQPVIRYKVPGSETTAFTGINNSMAIVGSYGTREHATIGFLYEAGKITQVLPPGATQSSVVAINDLGILAVRAIDSTGLAASYIETGTSFTSIAVPGAASTAIAGLNNLGGSFGTFQIADKSYHAFAYKAGTYTIFNAPSGAGFTAASLLGMNATGTIVGTYQLNTETVPFVATCTGGGC
jgi:hypothetical protein